MEIFIIDTVSIGIKRLHNVMQPFYKWSERLFFNEFLYRYFIF